jgi:hypothetical protein
MFSSDTLTSMKRTRSLGNLFVFMECEKSLKDTPLGSSFSCYHDEYEKTRKSMLGYVLIYFRARERTQTKLEVLPTKTLKK